MANNQLTDVYVNNITLYLGTNYDEMQPSNIEQELTKTPRKRVRKQVLPGNKKTKIVKPVYYQMDENDKALSPEERKKVIKAKKSREFRLGRLTENMADKKTIAELQRLLLAEQQKTACLQSKIEEKDKLIDALWKNRDIAQPTLITNPLADETETEFIPESLEYPLADPNTIGDINTFKNEAPVESENSGEFDWLPPVPDMDNWSTNLDNMFDEIFQKFDAKEL